MTEEQEKIEIKLAYMEAKVEELNEVVIEQERSIDSLTIQLRQLSKKVDDLIESEGESRPNRRPPHY